MSHPITAWCPVCHSARIFYQSRCQMCLALRRLPPKPGAFRTVASVARVFAGGVALCLLALGFITASAALPLWRLP